MSTMSYSEKENIMVCHTKQQNNNKREPAKNYRQRVRAIHCRMQAIMKAYFGEDNFISPSEETIEKGIDRFHDIMNVFVRAGRARGWPMKYYPGPLTEEEMRDLENRIHREVTILKVI